MKLSPARLACCLLLITLTYICTSLYLTPSNRFSRIERSQHENTSSDLKEQSQNFVVTKNTRVTSSSPEAVHNAEGRCINTEPNCSTWRDEGECILNPVFMLQSCAAACGLCRPSVPIGSQVTLNNGRTMPSIGFGTAGLGQQTLQAVHQALLAGYTLFDTAQAPEWYQEDLVGQAIQESTIPRKALFLTSKLHPRHHGFNSTLQQTKSSFLNLGTDYLDLMLLHYPRCWREICGDAEPEGSWQDSWRALEMLVGSGQIRSIGVSNFDLNELSKLWQMAHVKPAVIQRNSDPLKPDSLMQHYARLTGMQYQGYSTLGNQWLMKGYDHNPVLTHAAVAKAAQDIQRSPAQVVLRWALQHGQAVIPRSANPSRLRDNIALDFELPLTAMQSLDAIAQDIMN